MAAYNLAIKIANDEFDFIEDSEYLRTHFVITERDFLQHLDLTKIVSKAFEEPNGFNQLPTVGKTIVDL